MKKLLPIITALLVVAIGVGAFLYYTGALDKILTGSNDSTGDTTDKQPRGIFSPFNRPAQNTTGTGSTTNNTDTTSQDTTGNEIPSGPDDVAKIPKLRQLSTSPIGGMGASTTASTTIVRYIDRGTGHVYEVNSDKADIDKISNTTISRVYRSFWNKSASSMILQYVKEGDQNITTFSGTLRPKVSTSTDDMLYELRGRFLSGDIQSVSVSPKGDRIFTWVVDSGRGEGYVSNFDESNKVRVVDLPFTQVNIDWPTENLVTLTTKGTSYGTGIMYSIDITKPGAVNMKKVIGGIRGLSALMSKDGSKVLFTGSVGTNSIKTSLLNTKDNSVQEVIFKTMPEKCVWSTLHKNEIYCAVPTEIPSAQYPDSWYQSRTTFVDRLWHLDTETGEVHLLTKLLEDSGDLIDAVDLNLDAKENFLYFTNKNDLTLWSLDLNE